MPRKLGAFFRNLLCPQKFSGDFFSWKDYAPEIPECYFHKFSVPRKFCGQTAIHFVSIYFDQLCPLTLWGGGRICTSSYAWTVIVPSRGFFCCRVTFAWKKISVSEFTTDNTISYDITKALQEWKHTDPSWVVSKQMQKNKSNVQNTECIHTECICLQLVFQSFSLNQELCFGFYVPMSSCRSAIKKINQYFSRHRQVGVVYRGRVWLSILRG